MVIIGDGNKANAKAKDILLGDGVTVAGGDIAGSLHLGQGMEAVGGGVTAVGAGSSLSFGTRFSLNTTLLMVM
eukprot:CAMPEP_0201510798 /NCGR_PEP_ID=MMETSP0161_2-20130828/3359_1 /ASSEMBLY_ACC=CAM_ASM_000251 /TAXON_ID=180227 /ORGANISM="Neoparamoeba aestuarina, Strain SoJaBio B1-5/56/2" /LENGTH=72 /DNA_ID=CAMNT_0047906041 /DNA_START=645 /DNA_END=863 /DNA_ORIENTATION=+